jgi:hypothetical protein
VVELKGQPRQPVAGRIIRLRDRGVASNDYRLDRLIAYLRETSLARHLEKLFMKSQKALDKSQKAIDKTEKAVDKAVDKLTR